MISTQFPNKDRKQYLEIKIKAGETLYEPNWSNSSVSVISMNRDRLITIGKDANGIYFNRRLDEFCGYATIKINSQYEGKSLTKNFEIGIYGISNVSSHINRIQCRQNYVQTSNYVDYYLRKQYATSGQYFYLIDKSIVVSNGKQSFSIDGIRDSDLSITINGQSGTAFSVDGNELYLNRSLQSNVGYNLSGSVSYNGKYLTIEGNTFTQSFSLTITE